MAPTVPARNIDDRDEKVSALNHPRSNAKREDQRGSSRRASK